MARAWRRGASYLLIVVVALAAYGLRGLPHMAAMGSGLLDAWPRTFWQWQVTTIAGQAWQQITTWTIVAAFACAAGIPAARAMMRAHLHRGRSDLAARLSAWGAARRPLAWAVGASFAACAMSLAVVQSDLMWPARAPFPSGWAACLAAGALTLVTVFVLVMGRAAWRLLVAPLADVEASARDARTEDRMTFDAVAVTREARVGVVLMALLGATGAVLSASAELQYWSFLPATLVAAPIAYVVVAAALITQFLRASRITVGLDGILIHGTSRKRFFGYHDLDRAESTEWGEILLHRGDAVVLRLQPHGEDAARRADLAARIQACIDRSCALAAGTARRLADTATVSAMRGVARGGDGYRTTGVGRDELWQLVEAPVASSDHRCAAAEALGSTLEPDERRRMRVAAEHCADPLARDTLLRIAATAGDFDAEDEAVAEERSRRDPAQLPGSRLGA